MWTAYENIFAALFEWNLERWSGNENMASFLTAIGLGFVVSMNGMVVLAILVLIFGPLTKVPRGVLGLVGVSPVVLTYFLFILRDRYLDVVRRFKRRTTSEQRRTRIIAWSYVGISLFARVLTAILISRR